MKTALVASLLLLAAISPASATSPTEAVQVAAQQVVQVVQDPALAGPAAAERRRQEIQRIVETLFDLPEMTRRSLGGTGPTGRPRSGRSSLASSRGYWNTCTSARSRTTPGSECSTSVRR